MNERTRIAIGLAVLCILFLALSPATAWGQAIWSIFDNLWVRGQTQLTGPMVQTVPTVLATATPAMVINNNGLPNSLEIRKAATPVFYVDADGNVTYNGVTSSGGLVSGDTQIDGDLVVTGTLNTTEGITAATGLTATAGGLTVTAGGATITAGGLTVTAGTTNLDGGLAMDTNAFRVADTSGNTQITGTLLVTGATSLEGGLGMDTDAFRVADGTGDTQITGTLVVTGVTDLNAVLDMNSSVIQNVGNPGTDFNGSGGLTLASTLNMSKSNVISAGVINLNSTTVFIDDGGTITPTGTYNVVTSTHIISLSTSTSIATAGHAAGDLLIIRNGNATDDFLVDGTGGTVECKANMTVDAGDILELIFNGVVWNCVSLYDNS